MRKIVVDESVDYELVLGLRARGFHVLSILEKSAGISDDAVLDIALSESAILLTEDKDFGELTYRLHKPSCGVLLIRAINLPPMEKSALVSEIIDVHYDELRDNFAVLTSSKLRIKRIIH